MYRRVVGTGGIGKGMFFQFHENRMLGRNESRGAKLMKAEDYCKQHIVLCHISKLLCPGVQVIPIGKVGKDETGVQMKNMMEQAGMDVRYVEISEGAPTMTSICFQYPDKCGCNITADNSACNEVTPEYVLECMRQLEIDRTTVIAALPEVPLESRLAMLRYGKERGAFTAASLTVSEAEQFKELEGMAYCDLLALNEEEAAAAAGIGTIISIEDGKAAADKMIRQYPWLRLWITLGSKGSITADKEWVQAYPALSHVEVVNTGGAGDASLGGILAGLCSGLPFHGSIGDDFRMGHQCGSAAALGVLLGGLSVESADSINRSIDWQYVHRLLMKMPEKHEGGGF